MATFNPPPYLLLVNTKVISINLDELRREVKLFIGPNILPHSVPQGSLWSVCRTIFHMYPHGKFTEWYFSVVTAPQRCPVTSPDRPELLLLFFCMQLLVKDSGRLGYKASGITFFCILWSVHSIYHVKGKRRDMPLKHSVGKHVWEKPAY